MSLTQALRTQLAGDAELRDLIGDRVYPDEVPQHVPPSDHAVAYWQVGGSSYPTLAGPSVLAKARVQFDATGPRREVVDKIGQRIAILLDGLNGRLSVTREPTSGAVVIDDCQLENTYAAKSPPRDGDDNPLRRRTLSFLIHYQTAAVPQE